MPNLLWGTSVNLFSELFSLSLRRGSGEIVTQSEEDRPRIVTFTDRIAKPQNQLHCVTWDRDLWNAIDCETDRRDDFEYSSQFSSDVDGGDVLMVTVNCTCQSGTNNRFLMRVVQYHYQFKVFLNLLGIKTIPLLTCLLGNVQ